MDEKYEIDSLDLAILEYLQADSRTAYTEIARALEISGGTVHSRIDRMKELGIIMGSKVIIDYGKLGFNVTAFVGITLSKAGSFKKIQKQLHSIPEMVEVHYTTGTYSLFAKVVAKSMQDLYILLSEKLQRLGEVQSTETFVILNTPVNRDLGLLAFEE